MEWIDFEFTKTALRLWRASDESAIVSLSHRRAGVTPTARGRRTTDRPRTSRARGATESLSQSAVEELRLFAPGFCGGSTRPDVSDRGQ